MMRVLLLVFSVLLVGCSLGDYKVQCDEGTEPPGLGCEKMCGTWRASCSLETGWQCVGGPDKTEGSCNGKDDNCNGKIDEGFPVLYEQEMFDSDGKTIVFKKVSLEVGEDCFAGRGVCRRKGKVVCAADNKNSFCDAKPGQPQAPQSSPVPPATYPDVINPWDWNCDGTVKKYMFTANSYIENLSFDSPCMKESAEIINRCKSFGGGAQGGPSSCEQKGWELYCGSCGENISAVRCSWVQNGSYCGVGSVTEYSMPAFKVFCD